MDHAPAWMKNFHVKLPLEQKLASWCKCVHVCKHVRVFSILLFFYQTSWVNCS